MSDQLLSGSAVASEVPERFDPATMHGEIIEAEHLARYRWAAPLAVGRRVLDAGCGVAYGTALLAAAGAVEVIGVDRESDVLDSARPQMPGNVRLETGNVSALHYEGGQFDLVVCFEVIEHLDDPGRALDELRRVLAPDGLLAVSSPNREVYPPGNPHHLHEYTPGELEQELAARFSFVRLSRQHTWITSGVLEDDQFSVGGDSDLGSGVSVRKLTADEPGAELYTIALAGRETPPQAAATFELATSVELRRWDALWQEQAQMLERQAKVLEEQADLLSAHEQVFAEHGADRAQSRHEIDQLRGQLARTEVKLARMPALDAQLRELLQVNDGLLQLNHELQLRQENLDGLVEMSERYTVLVESTSWKVTRPLRRVAALARKFTN
jgi:2-polyprenyl-3-methyl-5-hydroxy-6-metoxy-1,4-benzoquinol methylase